MFWWSRKTMSRLTWRRALNGATLAERWVQAEDQLRKGSGCRVARIALG